MRIRAQGGGGNSNDDDDVLLSTVLNERMSLVRLVVGVRELFVGFGVLVVRVLLSY